MDGNFLKAWTGEDWGTKSLSDEDYRNTGAKKHAGINKGKQFSSQPEDAAVKTARCRSTGKSPAKANRPNSAPASRP